MHQCTSDVALFVSVHYALERFSLHVSRAWACTMYDNVWSVVCADACSGWLAQS